MVKTVLMLCVVLLLMIFDASVFYTEASKILFQHDIQSLFHIIIFIVFTLITRNIKLAIVAALGFELIQLFVPYRSFEIVDLLSNLGGCYIAQNLFTKHFKQDS